MLAALDRQGVERAIVCGISFGGLPAIRFAATYPRRTAALVVASVPGPAFHLSARHELYTKAPRLFGPLFFAESPFRLRAELASAFPTLHSRWRFSWRQLATFLRAPVSPSRMAARARLLATTDIVADCARIVAPTLVVTGERELDRVVSVDGTLAYLKLIAGSRHAQITGTGHVGSITKPETFASIVREFVEDAGRDKKDTHDAA